jgi:hypothetical protein
MPVRWFTWPSISKAVQLSPDELGSAHFDHVSFYRLSRELKQLMGDEFYGFTPAPCRIGTFDDVCARAVSEATVGGAQATRRG